MYQCGGFLGRSLTAKTTFLLSASISISAQGLPELPSISLNQGLKEADLLYPQRPASGDYKNQTTLQWRGESVQENGPMLILTNGVVELEDPRGGNVILMADSIDYNRFDQSIKASGAVRLEHSEFRMRCHSLEMKMIKSGDTIIPSGDAWGVTFELPPSWTLNSNHVYFVSYLGDSLGLLGKLTGGGKANRTTEFHFKEVSVSPCPQENPGWMAETSLLTLKTGAYDNSSGIHGYATLKNIVLKIGPVPIMWMPWIFFPARVERSPGLLLPALGYNSRLGVTLGVSYYQPLGQTADFTLSPTLYSREGVMWGGEARWAPELTHKGEVRAEYIRPRSTGEVRYRVNLYEIWDLENGWYVRADINHASDILMDAEFGRMPSVPLGKPTFDSSLYVGKDFKWAAFSLYASDKRIFFRPDDPFYNPNFPGAMQTIKMPEGQLQLYPITIGNFFLDGSARIGRLGYNFDVGEDSPTMNYYWSRADYQLRFRGRLGQLGLLRADLYMGARLTQYSAVLTDSFLNNGVLDEEGEAPSNPTDNPDFDPFRVDGPATQRWLSSNRLQFSTPQMGRSFLNLKVGRYSGDIKHILEPIIAFNLNSKNGLVGVFPRFDDVDTHPGVENSAVGERSVEFGLKQHLFGRPDSTSMYASLVRYRLSFKYYLDPIISPNGRIRRGFASSNSEIDVEPSRIFRLTFKRALDSEGNTDTFVSAHIGTDEWSRLNLTFFTSGLNPLLVRQRGIRIGGLRRLWDDKLRFQFEVNYDLERRTFSYSQVALAYVGPCVAYSVRYNHLFLMGLSNLRKEDRVDFALNLRNLGELFSVEIGNMFSGLFR